VRLVESCSENYCVPWKPLILRIIGRGRIVVLIMVKTLFDHRGARGSGDFRHVVVEDIHSDRTGGQDLGFDRGVAAMWQLTHDV
jgi:hypothetical protein